MMNDDTPLACLAKPVPAETGSGGRLDEVVKALRQRFPSAVFRGAGASSFRPTGARAFDALLPGGGLPLGRVSLVCGPPSSGRASLALLVAAGAAESNRPIAWIDTPGTFHPPSAATAGVDLDRMLLVQPKRGGVAEGVHAAVLLLRTGALALLVLDLGETEEGATRRWERKLVLDEDTAARLGVREEMTSEIRGRRCAAAARREERGVAIATRATSNEVRRGCSGGRNPEVILSRALSRSVPGDALCLAICNARPPSDLFRVASLAIRLDRRGCVWTGVEPLRKHEPSRQPGAATPPIASDPRARPGSPRALGGMTVTATITRSRLGGEGRAADLAFVAPQTEITGTP